jgi:hypothetical protein
MTMTERIKFLVMSNARSGSTWLESMLGELDDVRVDFEFKWRPVGYDPQPIHVVIPDGEFSCSRALQRISADAPVVGTKLVLDPRPHAREEYEALEKTIEEEIRIIHLKRDYTDTFCSLLRGCFNALSDPDRHGDSELIRTLRHHTENDVETALTRWRSEAREVPPDQVEYNMQVFLDNDEWIAGLSKGRARFMELDYREIKERFPEVAKFVGSSAPAEAVEKVLDNPVTMKLPSLAPWETITNYTRIIEIGNVYEQRKNVKV